MSSTLVEMKNSLASTKHKTKTLIEETLGIQKEINNVSTKRDIVSCVIQKLVSSKN